MPTIHRETGFRFVMWPNDHEPAHVHAVHADGMVGIELSAPPSVREVVGAVKNRQIQEALRITARMRKTFLKKWRTIHGD